MQEFFMDYGLWLLVGLLVIIGLVFLLSGKSKAKEVAPPAAIEAETMPVAAVPVAPPVAVAPVIVEPLVVEPVTVEPVAVEPVAVVEAETPAPVAAVAPEAGEDDLLRMKGVGPKLKALLHELGITRFAQIAAWTDTDIAAIDARLGNFKGRPIRDQWVDQAKYLAAGDIAGFEAHYGKL
jgi:predicted flap endonuclease-1-like 5' DNA nuclease